MLHTHSRTWKSEVTAVAVMAAVALICPKPSAAVEVTQPLKATGVAPRARGHARVVIKRHGRRLQGRMNVVVHNLAAGATFGVSVAGVQIGTLSTRASGTGVAHFSSRPRGRVQFLGVDPQGKLLEVSDHQGEDVLETQMPHNPGDQSEIQCCVADSDGTECEEATAAECSAANGGNMGAGSCSPNPCPTIPPPAPEQDIRCCVPHSAGPECEEATAAECNAANGVNMGAGACDPNPCPMPPPPPEPDIRCCLPDSDGPECEQETATACSAANGVNMGAGSCFPNPCPTTPPPPAQDIQCCLPDSAGPECQEETAADCSAANGVNIGAGACDPNPCASTPPGIITCCVPDDDGPECEQLTAADCTAEGGTTLSATSCAPNPCPASPSGAFVDGSISF